MKKNLKQLLLLIVSALFLGLALTPLVSAQDPIDSDGDGMPDAWEIDQGFDPFDPADAMNDADSDGLYNLDEYYFGTNPHVADTDGDSMPDYWEVGWYLDPLNPGDAGIDVEPDGLTNLEEYLVGTDPNQADADQDGVFDPQEISAGTNPNDGDTDNDGLSDGEEPLLGLDPLARDTDLDGEIDGLQHGSIIRLSHPDPAVPYGWGETSGAALSGDGRFAVFVSDHNGLLTGDTNEAMDVFWTDTVTGELRRVSVASDGSEGNDWSGRISNSIGLDISDDGRLVVFQSNASNLVTGDTNHRTDIFLHDTEAGETTRINLAADGSEGDSSSYAPSMSADGRFIAYRSGATNLVEGPDSNDWRHDIFVLDRKLGITRRVSVNTEGVQANDESGYPQISADGTTVVFTSDATNLVPNDTNGSPNGFYGVDVFVHDLDTGQTSRVSVASDGTEQTVAGIYEPTISGDGRLVAFSTSASNLVPGDSGSYMDIFVHDRDTHETERVSVAPDGTEGNGHSTYPVISDDGRYLTFFSSASNLVVGDTNRSHDLFFLDRRSAEFKLLSRKNDGSQLSQYFDRGPAISADGRFIQFTGSAYLLTPDSTGDMNSYLVKTGVPLPIPGPKLHTAVVSDVSSSDWKLVSLPYIYDSMVVVATPVYDATSPPLVTRIRNAVGSSFELKVDRADGGTSVVGDIQVHYVVVEEGLYTVADDGIALESLKVESNLTDGKGSWVGQPLSITGSYTAPVVLGQVMSYNDPGFSTFWCRGKGVRTPPSATDIRVGKQVAEDTQSYRADETLGVIVMESGSGKIGGFAFEAGLGADSVRGVSNGVYTYSLDTSNVPSTAILSQAAMDGNNGGWAVLHASGPLSPGQLTLAIDEDQMRDNERKHTTEQVGYAVFKAGVE